MEKCYECKEEKLVIVTEAGEFCAECVAKFAYAFSAARAKRLDAIIDMVKNA